MISLLHRFINNTRLALRRADRRLVSTTVATYGILWTGLEAYNSLLPAFAFVGKAPYITIVAISIVSGLHRIYPKSRITIKIPQTDCRIVVKFGDLFNERQHKIISVNDCFDTNVGAVVAQESLHARFIRKYFQENTTKLDDDIRSSLKGAQGQTIERPNGGNTIKYPIGTTAIVHTGENPAQRAFLLALSRTQPTDNYAITNLPDFWMALHELWQAVRRGSEDEEVAVPLLGSGLSRVPLPAAQLAMFIIASFSNETRVQRVTRSLSIVIDQRFWDDIDLGYVKRIFGYY